MTTECKIDGCRNKRHGFGWCKSHYERFKRHGDPLKGGTANGEPLDHLNKSLEILTDECMFWPFGKDTKGYGMIHMNGKKLYAHRVVCEIVNGPSPDDKPISRHLCGKGDQGCFNHRHVVWGDQIENMADTKLHGTKVEGEKVGTAKLTENQVLEIFNRGKSGESGASLAKEFNVSFSSTCAIIRGSKWAWLTGAKKKGGN